MFTKINKSLTRCLVIDFNEHSSEEDRKSIIEKFLIKKADIDIYEKTTTKEGNNCRLILRSNKQFRFINYD